MCMPNIALYSHGFFFLQCSAHVHTLHIILSGISCKYICLVLLFLFTPTFCLNTPHLLRIGGSTKSDLPASPVVYFTCFTYYHMSFCGLISLVHIEQLSFFLHFQSIKQWMSESCCYSFTAVLVSVPAYLLQLLHICGTEFISLHE
jgi:hypothetical protein